MNYAMCHKIISVRKVEGLPQVCGGKWGKRAKDLGAVKRRTVRGGEAVARFSPLLDYSDYNQEVEEFNSIAARD
jgi:hypothetical protein